VLGLDRVHGVRGRVLAGEQRARAKVLHRLVLIVRATANLNVLGRRRTTARERDDVVEFQEPCLIAPAFRTGEGAAATVARPHGAAHGGGDVTAALADIARRTRRPRLCELRSLEVRDQQRQRPIDNLRRIAVRHRMPQQVLRAPQLVVRFAADGELHLVPLGRERPGSPPRRSVMCVAGRQVLAAAVPRHRSWHPRDRLRKRTTPKMETSRGPRRWWARPHVRRAAAAF
jgi:hypothetical protein